MNAIIETISKEEKRELYKLSYEEKGKIIEEVSPFLQYLINQVKDKVEMIKIIT